MARRKVEDEPQVSESHESEVAKTLKDIAKAHGQIITKPITHIANHIPTGIFALDFALCGGYAQGFPCMLAGAENSGKTTGAMRAIAAWQRKCEALGLPNNQSVFVDMEGTYDSLLAARLGVNPELVHHVRPPNGQVACDIILAMVEPLEIGIIVLDTIAACATEKQLGNSLSDETRSELPKLMTTFSNCLTRKLAEQAQRGHDVTPILLNQVRVQQGVLYGDNTGFPGGNYVTKHLPTTIIQLRKNKRVDFKNSLEMDAAERNLHTFSVRKSKHAPPEVQYGEYEVIASPDSPSGVDVAHVDDAATIRAYAQKFGFIEGRFKVPAVYGEKQFAKLSEIEAAITEEPESKAKLSRLIIAAQRKRLGLPQLPPDGYLITL